MASKMVMAIGENGPELTPADEVVEIQAIPLGEDNLVVPATVRWMSSIRSGGVPTRIRKIRRPTKHCRYVVVEFDCTPFSRFTNPDGSPYMGNWSSCVVRHLRDAGHEVFAGLTNRERTRIARAVETAEARRAGGAA